MQIEVKRRGKEVLGLKLEHSNADEIIFLTRLLKAFMLNDAIIIDGGISPGIDMVYHSNMTPEMAEEAAMKMERDGDGIRREVTNRKLEV